MPLFYFHLVSYPAVPLNFFFRTHPAVPLIFFFTLTLFCSYPLYNSTYPAVAFFIFALNQATTLFLLRTEVIGLNGWLASINVPGIEAKCGGGWHTQTVHHVLMLCPLHSSTRADLVRRTDTEEMVRMLSTPEKAQASARWFVQQGILQQFNLAKDIEEEDVTGHTPFQPLEVGQDFP